MFLFNGFFCMRKGNELLEQEDERKYSVPGLERGLRILMEFSANEPILTAPELARRLDIPRSTVFRILQTLVSLGFLEKGKDERYFRLGTAVLRLGFDYLNSLELVDLSLPILARLRDHTTYSSQLVIQDGRDVVCIAKAASRDFSFSNVNVGARLPAHATVLGRVLMGDLCYEELLNLFPEKKLHRFTEFTPEDVDQLFQMIQSDMKHGYAISQSFFEVGISALSVPIFDETGRIVAALGITIPMGALDKDPLIQQHLLNELLVAANELSRQLNYRGDRLLGIG
jgi:DNA-binding IclR family transcriptional regulator